MRHGLFSRGPEHRVVIGVEQAYAFYENRSGGFKPFPSNDPAVDACKRSSLLDRKLSAERDRMVQRRLRSRRNSAAMSCQPSQVAEFDGD
jgi:hypothetical protein